MILVRDIFQVKFGKMRDAVAAFKEVGRAVEGTAFESPKFRVLTDLVGQHYTLVLESTHDNLASYEKRGQEMMGSPEWREAYQKFTPHVESGRREIFNIVQ